MHMYDIPFFAVVTFFSSVLLLHGCYYDYFEAADWAHSEIRNARSHIYMVVQVRRCAYHILWFVCALNACICVWEGLFSNIKLIHAAGYTIYFFCILNEMTCLSLVVVLFCFVMTLPWSLWMDRFSISNSKILSDYSLNLVSVELHNAIFLFCHVFESEMSHSHTPTCD